MCKTRNQSDTPGKAGGLMSGAASKAVGPSDGHRWHRVTVLRLDPKPSWFVGLLLLAQSGSALLHLTVDCCQLDTFFVLEGREL